MKEKDQPKFLRLLKNDWVCHYDGCYGHQPGDEDEKLYAFRPHLQFAQSGFVCCEEDIKKWQNAQELELNKDDL